ncbi:MAG: type II secretion system F family protein [Limimaricola soesokkakensis]|uniref:type II secretion system F family protein n=1 Tax=Limimaricola soesokkakensis TaxID=1343159 RepID=UPI00405946B9
MTSLITIFLLAAFSVGGLLFSAFQPRLAMAATRKKRLQLVLGDHASDRRQVAVGQDGKRHRRSVEDTLKEIQKKQKAQAKSRSRMTLQGRLRQADLDWSKPKYLIVCVASGLISYPLAWVGLGMGPAWAAIAGVAGAVLLPRVYVAHKRKRRFQAFTEEFANAVDVIVRGVKSGMPIGDCLRVVATEGQEPVRSEFRMIVDDQTLGMPVQEAVERLVGRVPLPETNFLSTVLTIQSRSGGNLTEALGNLSTVLRDRKKMQAKIKAMSAEAKASAGIIGALPPLVAGILFLTSPGYISLLFTTTIGNVVLIGCGIWMLMGVLVMRKMINFDF